MPDEPAQKLEKPEQAPEISLEQHQLELAIEICKASHRNLTAAKERTLATVNELLASLYSCRLSRRSREAIHQVREQFPALLDRIDEERHAEANLRGAVRMMDRERMDNDTHNSGVLVGLSKAFTIISNAHHDLVDLNLELGKELNSLLKEELETSIGSSERSRRIENLKIETATRNATISVVYTIFETVNKELEKARMKSSCKEED
jgi:hypothetical protein